MNKCPISGKIRYRSYDEANEIMTKINHTIRKVYPVRIYMCEKCSGFHLTKMENKTEPIKRLKLKSEFRKFIDNQNKENE